MMKLPPMPEPDCDVFYDDGRDSWGYAQRGCAVSSESAKQLVRADRAAVLDAVAAFIADDAYAISFQTMGQYRTALLSEIRKAAQDARKE
jgi:hypothetical protein